VASNVDLSRRRAQAVVDALVSRHGIAPNRLQAQGVANFAPAAVNTSEDGRAKNRRVEMVVR
jgi:OOP family OmpA-OmpF porin